MKHKSYIVLLLFMVTSAVAMGGQRKVLRWGIEAGLDMNKMALNKAYFASKDNQMGWFLGIKGSVAIPLGGLGLDAAVLYDNKRFTYCSLYDGETPVAAIDLDYQTRRFNLFCIPLNVRYSFGVGTLCSIYVATGPQINWYIGDGEKLGFGSRLNHQYCSWNLGAGIELFRHVQLGFTYSIATEAAYTDLRTTASQALDHAFEGRNNSWQVRLGWWF